MRTLIAFVLSLSCLGSCLLADDATLQYAALSPELVAVPQNVLGLAHSPEVQHELGFDDSKLAQFETTLREIDTIWWPARIQPVEQQRKIVSQLELKLVAAVQKLGGKLAVDRLRQIELQSQSSRVVLRPEVSKYLKLDGAQTKKLNDIFSATDELGKNLKPDDTERAQKFAAAQQDEPAKALAVLLPAQIDKLRRAFGEPLDTRKLERIYPLAPELIDSAHWANDRTVDLKSLRGNVVLLHFYAFQCHNCIANFSHYKRWDETLREQGVTVIGIQTPETSAEREPEKVIAAASKDGFKFPVLIDLESKNWKAWGNTMWPTVYVIDKQGYIRFWWQGELNWQGATVDKKIEEVVAQLLKE